MEKFMKEALRLAKIAYKKDEVPVGAVIVKDNKIIAKAYNKRQKLQDATLHAEIIAIKKACKKLHTFRLNDCTIFVTLEPCAMCSGAVINARVGTVVFGAYDQKYGCCGSIYNLPEDNRFNHRAKVIGGVMEKECRELLTQFFESKRRKD
mgnify:CR=1 FL=1